MKQPELMTDKGLFVFIDMHMNRSTSNPKDELAIIQQRVSMPYKKHLGFSKELFSEQILK